MQTLFRVVFDGRSEILKVAPRAALIASVGHVGAAGLAGNLAELLCAPKFIEPCDPARQLT
jgi:hypothetical protein